MSALQFEMLFLTCSNKERAAIEKNARHSAVFTQQVAHRRLSMLRKKKEEKVC